MKARINHLESLIQPLLQKVEELVVSKLTVLEEVVNKHKSETTAMGEALTQTSLRLSKTEDRQHTLAEAQVDLRMTMDEISQSIKAFKPPGIKRPPIDVNISTPPSFEQAFPGCGLPTRTLAEEQSGHAGTLPRFMTLPMPAIPSVPTGVPHTAHAGPNVVEADLLDLQAFPTVHEAYPRQTQAA